MANYAVLSYSTSNVGDDIQSLAAIRVLRKLGITSMISFINREHISEYKGPPVKLIMNGWFTHAPAKFRPPTQVTPIFIGFHLHVTKILTDNIDYFKQYEPIGCRDEHTKEQFEKHGIKAYMSYCLTLTLDSRIPNSMPNGSIYIVDGFATTPPKYMINKPNIKKIKHNCMTAKMTIDQRLSKARGLLDMYKKASKIVTSRLHAALPCIAMGVPVEFHHRKLLEDPRFKGYETILKTGKVPDLLKMKIVGFVKNAINK